MRAFFGIFLLTLLFSCSPLPKGSGKSTAKGSVGKGELINGRRFPYKGNNYRYFSPVSFAFFNRAWVHEKVLKITLEAYAALEKTHPDRQFLLMECSKKHGGRMRPHRTHQNGTSIDFGTPLMKKGKPHHNDRHRGLMHYAMRFDEHGVLKRNKNIRIDFETMGEHLLALEKAARKEGMYIKKVIFKIDLKDDFFKSKAGRKVKKKGIYFAKKLPKNVDNVHDDHYHVDFAFLK